MGKDDSGGRGAVPDDSRDGQRCVMDILVHLEVNDTGWRAITR
ncbi:MAG: hypothetical protein QW379_08725 [Thermoplasmata archaeon]